MRDDDVRRRLATVPLVASAALALTAFGEVSLARAQTVPEGQSCGGLVCDLGLFGHKTTPGATTASPAQTVAAPPVAAEPKAPKVRKPKHFAKAVAPTPAAIATPISPQTAPAAAATMAPTPSLPTPVVSTRSAPVAPAAGKPAVAAASAPRAKDEVYIRPNPYTSGLPAPTLILPIGPAPPQP